MPGRNRNAMSLLDEVLERRMLLYVLAAGATLAGVPSAQAKVVFTPSSEDLSPLSAGLPPTLHKDLAPTLCKLT